jgi:hypothetical protein
MEDNEIIELCNRIIDKCEVILQNPVKNKRPDPAEWLLLYALAVIVGSVLGGLLALLCT